MFSRRAEQVPIKEASRPSKTWTFLLATVAMLLAVGATAQGADTCTFQGPGNDWHAGGNWSCMHVPTGADNAILDNDTVTIAADAEAASLSVASSDLTVAGGAKLTVGSLTVNGGAAATAPPPSPAASPRRPAPTST